MDVAVRECWLTPDWSSRCTKCSRFGGCRWFQDRARHIGGLGRLRLSLSLALWVYLSGGTGCLWSRFIQSACRKGSFHCRESSTGRLRSLCRGSQWRLTHLRFQRRSQQLLSWRLRYLHRQLQEPKWFICSGKRRPSSEKRFLRWSEDRARPCNQYVYNGPWKTLLQGLCKRLVYVLPFSRPGLGIASWSWSSLRSTVQRLCSKCGRLQSPYCGNSAQKLFRQISHLEIMSLCKEVSLLSEFWEHHTCPWPGRTSPPGIHLGLSLSNRACTSWARASQGLQMWSVRQIRT